MGIIRLLGCNFVTIDIQYCSVDNIKLLENTTNTKRNEHGALPRKQMLLSSETTE